MKLQISIIMLIMMVMALIMLTDWVLFMLLSENTSAMGRTTSSRHQRNVMAVCGFSFSPGF